MNNCHCCKCCNFKHCSDKGQANIISWLLSLVSNNVRTNVVKRNTLGTNAWINVAKKCCLTNWHCHICCIFKSRSSKGKANIIKWLLPLVSGYLRTNVVKRNTLGTNVRINVAKKCCLSNHHWHKCCNFKSHSTKSGANINTCILLFSSNFVIAKVAKKYLDKYRYKKESLEQLPLAQMLQFQKSQCQMSGKHH